MYDCFSEKFEVRFRTFNVSAMSMFRDYNRLNENECMELCITNSSVDCEAVHYDELNGDCYYLNKTWEIKPLGYLNYMEPVSSANLKDKSAKTFSFTSK